MLHCAARCSSLVDKPFSPKAADRLPFALTKSQKRPHARTQRSSSRTSKLERQPSVPQRVSARQAKTSSRLSACGSLLTICNHGLAPGSIEYCMIALPVDLPPKCGVSLHVAAGRMIAVDRATAGPGSKRATGPRTACTPELAIFFFWIRGSTDL